MQVRLIGRCATVARPSAHASLAVGHSPCGSLRGVDERLQGLQKWQVLAGEIPKPLRKLSVRLTKVLRPLEIDVVPVKKASNGYRMHSAMIRSRSIEESVKKKIQEARACWCAVSTA